MIMYSEAIDAEETNPVQAVLILSRHLRVEVLLEMFTVVQSAFSILEAFEATRSNLNECDFNDHHMGHLHAVFLLAQSNLLHSDK